MGDRKTEGGVAYLALVKHSSPNDFQAKAQGVLKTQKYLPQASSEPSVEYAYKPRPASVPPSAFARTEEQIRR